MNTLTESQKLFISLIIGFLLGVVVTALGFSLSNNNASEVQITMQDEVAATEKMEVDQEGGEVRGVVASSGNSVTIDDQPAGATVSITRVSLSSPGWVAIHETAGGEPTNILGAARFDEGVSERTVTLLRGTEAGLLYIARLYQDNDDRAFNPDTDPLLVDDKGRAIEDSFVTTP